LSSRSFVVKTIYFKRFYAGKDPLRYPQPNTMDLSQLCLCGSQKFQSLYYHLLLLYVTYWWHILDHFSSKGKEKFYSGIQVEVHLAASNRKASRGLIQVGFVSHNKVWSQLQWLSDVRTDVSVFYLKTLSCSQEDCPNVRCHIYV
jgi:hypothetical protein